MIIEIPEINKIYNNQFVNSIDGLKFGPKSRIIINTTCTFCGYDHSYSWHGWVARIKNGTIKCNRCPHAK